MMQKIVDSMYLQSKYIVIAKAMKHQIYLLFTIFATSIGPVSAAVFTSNTLIAPTDFSYENQDIVISNCIVTVDGPHTFSSLRVATGGTLTHLNPLSSTTNAGLFLTVSNDVEVEAGAIISASRLGYSRGSVTWL